MLKNAAPKSDRAGSGAGSLDSAARTTLAPPEYQAIHDFLEEHAGIRLGTGKEYLVTSRLGRLFPRFGLAGYRDLVAGLSAAGCGPLQTAVVDAMTTNETFWFRDAAHFCMLVDLVSETRQSGLRIWSAAASTGQEAYTTAICLQDAMQVGRLRRPLNYEIVGTDISATALAEAAGGIYCGVSASRGLSDEQRRRYFRDRDGCIEVLPQYRQGIGFRSFNLLKSFDVLGRFDVVFCRNVLIYFSQERKRDIISRIARALNPGGHLFLGSTESMSGNEDLFEMRSFAGGLAYRVRS